MEAKKWGIKGGKASATGGYKADTMKLRMELIDPIAMEGLAGVLTFGAQKYGDRNWEKGIEWTRIFGSIARHLNAMQKGEDYDPESGMPHCDHLLTNAMFLSRFFRTHKNLDDRASTQSQDSSAPSVEEKSPGFSNTYKKWAKSQPDLGVWNEPEPGIETPMQSPPAGSVFLSGMTILEELAATENG